MRKLLIIGCLCLPLLSFTKKKKKQVSQVATADQIDFRQLKAPLPPLRLVKINGDAITNTSLKRNGNLFIMMFNPLCEHCEDMTADIVKNVALFRKSKVVLVAGSAMGAYLKDFEKNLKVAGHEQLMIGLDSSKVYDRLYNYNNLPQINIYDHKHRLIRTINGQETIDSLRQYIE